jgi:hypothetical protein
MWREEAKSLRPELVKARPIKLHPEPKAARWPDERLQEESERATKHPIGWQHHQEECETNKR